MVKKADLLSGTGSALRDLDTKKGWYGRSAERFGDKNDQEPTRWWEAGGAFRSGGAALNAYADALEHAQNEAARAKQEYQRGEDATREARAAYAEYEGRYNKLKSQAISDGLEYPWAKEPFTDPGDEIRKNALEILATAKRGREDAARVCAADVRSACRNAPEKRNWLENRIHTNIEILKGAGEAVWDLVEMGFSKYNPQWQMYKSMLRGLGLMEESDLTTEELKMQFQLDGETLEQAWGAAKEDPLEFGKQLGKGMLDWDTWADNPARAVGHLLPDIIAAILTGGTAGAAGRGLRIGASIADTIGDVGSAAKGLTRAADAVEEIGDTLNVGKKLFGSAPASPMPDIDVSGRGVPHQEVPAVSSMPDTPSEPPPSISTGRSDAPGAAETPASPPTPTSSASASAPGAPAPATAHTPAASVAEATAPAPTTASHGATPTPASSPSAGPPGQGPSATDASIPVNRFESRLGTIPDTGQSFLDSRLGGHGDAGPTPTPSDSPISRLDGDPTQTVREPDLDRSEIGGHPRPEDPVRPDPALDGDRSSVVDPDIDSHDPSDGEGIAPGEDPVHIEDHTKPEARLDRDDYPNTQDYAGEAYNRINPYLRGEYDAPPFMGADDMIDGVKRELDSLPPTQEVSHRGMYMERSMVDHLFGGERFSDPAFLSTSKSPDVASNWIDELHDNRDTDAAPKDKVLVRVEGHSGRDITDISLNSGEKEILFKPGTEFDVVGRHWNGAEGRWEIDLREVGYPDDPGSPHGHTAGSDGHLAGPGTNHDPDGPPDTGGDHSGPHHSTEVESPYTENPSDWGAGQYHDVLDAALPHLDAPESITESVKKVNELGYWADKERYGNNCHNVVEALELRARGYDVTAHPTVEGAMVRLGDDPTSGAVQVFEGRHLPNIESGWRQSDGSIREFEYLSDHSKESPTSALEAYGRDLPVGSRGFITGAWNSGGTGHIFSFTKDADGTLRLFDGQTNMPDASSHLDRMRFNQRESNPWHDIRIMRVDDLTPTDEVLQAARPDDAATKAETVAWGHGIRTGNPLELPEAAVQREVDTNQHWRDRNTGLFDKFNDVISDPGTSPAEKSQAAGMLNALKEQNYRLDVGRYNFEMRRYEAFQEMQARNGES